MPEEQPYHDWTITIGDYPQGLLVTSATSYVFIGHFQLDVGPLQREWPMAAIPVALLLASHFVYRKFGKKNHAA
jgi:hypothetical protein